MIEAFRDRDAEAKLPSGEPEREVTVVLRIHAGGEVEADLHAVGDEEWIDRCLARSVTAEKALLAILGSASEHVATVSMDKGRID